MPLVVTPAHAVPLHFDGAQYLRLQDLVIRGGGHDTILFDQADQIEFDNVTVWCGANGIRAKGLRNFRLHHSGYTAMCRRGAFRTRHKPPLAARQRHARRYATQHACHAGARRQSRVRRLRLSTERPVEISYCTFSDGHDGVYVGGLNVRFHHNLIERTQDDGIY